MKFKNLKCIEITKKEFKDIKFINTIATCQAHAVELTSKYLSENNNFSSLPNSIINTMAYNLYMAVINEYKYLKVVD